MTHEEILQGLYDNTLIGNAPEVKDLVNQGLEDELEPEKMLYDALIPSLEEVGARFERGDFFVPEMLIAARAMQGALDRLEPDAAHLRLHLAVPVRAHAAAGAVAQRLRALHRTGQPGRVEHALAAHVAAEDRLLHRRLDQGDRLHHAGTALRFRWIRSFASRTAADASEA